MDSDRHEIQAVLSGIVAASEAGDPDAYVNFVTNDAVMMWDEQPAVIGRDAIHAFMSGFSNDVQFDFQWETDEIQITDDWAFHRYNGVAVITPSDEGEAQRLDRKYIDILRKENGTWKISRHIYNRNE